MKYFRSLVMVEMVCSGDIVIMVNISGYWLIIVIMKVVGGVATDG